ncbi:hypothetical protein AB1E18_015898 [Capra hircus]
MALPGPPEPPRGAPRKVPSLLEMGALCLDSEIILGFTSHLLRRRTKDHGFPRRASLPGTRGARSLRSLAAAGTRRPAGGARVTSSRVAAPADPDPRLRADPEPGRRAARRLGERRPRGPSRSRSNWSPERGGGRWWWGGATSQPETNRQLIPQLSSHLPGRLTTGPARTPGATSSRFPGARRARSPSCTRAAAKPRVLSADTPRHSRCSGVSGARSGAQTAATLTHARQTDGGLSGTRSALDFGGKRSGVREPGLIPFHFDV